MTKSDAMSPRQRQVLKRICRGKCTKEIAFELGVSEKTVEFHRFRLYDRILGGERNQVKLAVTAIRNGLIEA